LASILDGGLKGQGYEVAVAPGLGCNTLDLDCQSVSQRLSNFLVAQG